MAGFPPSRDQDVSPERPAAAAQAPSQNAERPLVEDIRLLGRILGDVIREQEGADAFERIERIRKLSVAFRRHGDAVANRAMKRLLKGLSDVQAIGVIRAFTYFSHLANLAEDRHHIRRRTVHERAGHAQEGSIEVTMSRLRRSGVPSGTVVRMLEHSLLSPVLTAHPTEVQRKSILDAERGRSRTCWPSATRSGREPSEAIRARTCERHDCSRPTRRSCAPACCSCGRRDWCAAAH